MNINVTEDIRSVTELKRKTREIIDQARRTGRPVILTANGKADAVLMDAETYEKQFGAANLSALLAAGEADIAAGRSRPARTFLREFKRAHKISG
jgi:prevent-host-death family protein